ncbi:MAG: alcohol dehydrogenase catalytic domain-containing protein, partial [Rhodoferax sp.]|nr:alcohol dehydrogenase catalytic domain-containing protein [Rhodoferax sp.]
MLTVICETPGQLRAVDRPMPERAPDEVLLRVKRVGVCGTDLHIFTGDQPYLAYPRVMGHELSGIVEQAPADSPLRAGDTAYVMPYLSCGDCVACRQGKTNCCVNIQVLGVHRDGAFTEYLAVPQQFVHKAEGVTLDQAAMVEFLAIGAHAVRRAAVR